MARRLCVSLACLFVGALWLSFMPTSSAAEETLKIGSIWGLSGPMSQLGVVCRDGALLAVDWINATGGIAVQGKKYKVQLLVEDNKNTAPGSVNAATKLVHLEKVKFVTGMNIPFEIEAVETVTEPADVILSTAKASNLVPKNRHSFSATQGFTAPIPNIYEFLKRTYPDVKTVGFIANDEAGALITSKIARSIAETAFGYKLQETNLVQFGAHDFYPTWTKIMKEKPDAVDLVISAPDDLASKARQGREVGFKGPILTCNTGDANTFLHLIGKDATDFIFAGYDPGAADTPSMVKMIAKLWDQKYKKPFSLDGVDGFSSVWALTQAIEKAQSLDPEKVVATWEKMETIETPTGTGKMGGLKAFGINHMVFGPSPVSVLKNEKVEKTIWYKPADM